MKSTTAEHAYDHRTPIRIIHTVRNYYKTKLCPYFFDGKCTKGAKCSFAHDQSELRKSPNLKKTKLCDDYMNGMCEREDCPFAHGESELRATSDVYKTSLCKLYKKGTFITQGDAHKETNVGTRMGKRSSGKSKNVNRNKPKKREHIPAKQVPPNEVIKEKVDKLVDQPKELVLDSRADIKQDSCLIEKLSSNPEKKPKVYEPVKKLNTLKTLVGTEGNGNFIEFLSANELAMDDLRCVWMKKPIKALSSVATAEEINYF